MIEYKKRFNFAFQTKTTMMYKLIIYVGLFLIGCGQDQNQDASYPSYAPEGEMMEARRTDDSPSTAETSLKQIRHGQLRLVADDAASLANNVRQVTSRRGGTIMNEYENRYGSVHEVSLELHIPALSLDSVISELILLADRVENRSISMSDVTGAYRDTDARLQNKKALETRYLDILKSAKNIEEIMAIERELSAVRTEIEMMESQQKQIDDQVAMSRLHVSCVAYGNQMDNFSSAVTSAFKQGWANLLSFMITLVRGWGIILFVGLLVWFVRYVIRRRRSR